MEQLKIAIDTFDDKSVRNGDGSFELGSDLDFLLFSL